MYLKKIIRYINYFPYYLEVFAKRLNGRGLKDYLEIKELCNSTLMLYLRNIQVL